MNRLFFARSNIAVPIDEAPVAAAPPQPDFHGFHQALLKAQSITASAIFAALVGKGILTAEEADAQMREIAEALAIDVPAPVGQDASQMLDSYRRALGAALG